MAFLGFALLEELPILRDSIGLFKRDRERVHVHLRLLIKAAGGVEIELKSLGIR